MNTRISDLTKKCYISNLYSHVYYLRTHKATSVTIKELTAAPFSGIARETILKDKNRNGVFFSLLSQKHDQLSFLCMLQAYLMKNGLYPEEVNTLRTKISEYKKGQH